MNDTGRVIVTFYKKHLTPNVVDKHFWVACLKFSGEIALVIGLAVATVMGRRIILAVGSAVLKTVGKVIFNSVFGIVSAVWGLGKVIWKIWGLHK
jgi:Mg/Co/Ni transporter MgtE